ncbi:Uncharacterized protein AXF42_Ash016724 [Apostasia shenzhenica]|uniref:Uncharacterized protein n=1 Tax=Apostasia shenzhenica TaxID=1088818 RepID=A0A2I0AQ61_9ASPA|nr:Uncharacterized protein AXF42_Ash016724 [Apostasia shenzhenica]
MYSGLFFPIPNPNRDPAPSLPTRCPALSRLVAIGDLHDDLRKSLQALSLAGHVDPFSLRWTGETAVAAHAELRFPFVGHPPVIVVVSGKYPSHQRHL